MTADERRVPSDDPRTTADERRVPADDPRVTADDRHMTADERRVPADGSRPTPVPLRWERREPPLPAAAVLALGEDVPALAAATRDRLLTGTRLGVTADATALLVLGATEDLPWAPGARYLGLDGDLLVPTTARPQPAAALWRTALGAGEGQLCVLVPGHALVADRPPPGTDPAALDSVARGVGER